jgi:VanZ family protein
MGFEWLRVMSESLKEISRTLWNATEFCVDVVKISIKAYPKQRTRIMDPSHIFGYVSFGLVLLLLLGLVGFTWVALHKIRSCPVL